jgi:hypothetical protein
MVGAAPLLVALVTLIDRLPQPPPPAARGRGSPRFYPDALFLKALLIMSVRHLYTPPELLAVLAQPTAEMRALRGLLTHDGRFPCRRTWERHLAALPTALPAQIGCLGRHLVALVQPGRTPARAVAVDSTTLQARGGVWHKVHRDRGDSRTRASTPKPTGPGRAGTAGSTAGSSNRSRPRRRCGSPWRRP